jgi:hypothetical protein
MRGSWPGTRLGSYGFGATSRIARARATREAVRLAKPLVAREICSVANTREDGRAFLVGAAYIQRCKSTRSSSGRAR